MEFFKIYKNTLDTINSMALSLWVNGKHPMRKAVEDMLLREKVLAEPVFQSMFGWKHTDEVAWLDWFQKECVRKLLSSFSPYSHQCNAWKVLTGKVSDKKSVVVTSGTGSGKTECFMYPILDDIDKDRSAVQAIFLYPLNALMADQCNRLNKLCNKLDVRFAVYNGNTPEYGTHILDDARILTRTAIRDKKTTPQILLSNPSMLEYVLLRDKDKDFIERSKKQLKWIVIDEAHTYTGSAAVELKYQIGRILEAFDMDVNDVHFVCTSATIGDNDAELADFISRLTGQNVDKIEVIGGSRDVPQMTNSEIEGLIADNEWGFTADCVQMLRADVNQTDGMHLREIWNTLFPNSKEYDIEKALKAVDYLCGFEQKLLMLRGHFFAKSVNGMYACSNPDCPKHGNSDLGYITTEKSSVCPHCQKPLLELVQCKRCGEFMLQGTLQEYEDGRNYIKRTNCKDVVENASADVEDDISIVGEREFVVGKLKADYPPMDGLYRVFISNENNRLIYEFAEDNEPANFVTKRNGNNQYACTHCGTTLGKNNSNYFRLPSRILTKTVALPLLSATAQDDAFIGKYIAFTDSRQGTATITKELNVESERNVYRSLFARFNRNPMTPTLSDAKSFLCGDRMFVHLSSDRDAAASYLKAIYRNAIGRRPLYENSLESLGLVSIIYPSLDDAQLPNCLIGTPITETEWRNFLKIALDYVVRMGNHIQAVEDKESRFVRNNTNCTPIEDNPWSVDAAKPSKLVLLLCAALGISSEEQLREQNNIDVINGILCCAWDFLKQNVLTQVDQADRYFCQNSKNLNKYYLDLSPLSGVFSLVADGAAERRSYCLARPESLWYCPMTRKLIDVTFCGYSPAMKGAFANIPLYKVDVDNVIKLPAIPSEYKDLSAIKAWLESNNDVRRLKELGLWTNIHEAAYCYTDRVQYVAAEHSAQQGQNVQERYADEFKNGSLNILNCSTTMEMGVDIGDVELVLLTTIPPTAANYMQRAGRAGRAGQNRAAVYSICTGDNIGNKVFNDPMWAITANHPISHTRESQQIVQRHINSFYFRQFVLRGGIELGCLEDFFEKRDANGCTCCERFISFLQECDRPNSSIYSIIKSRFELGFGNKPFDSRVIKESIVKLRDSYSGLVADIRNAINDAVAARNVNKQRAIEWQLYRLQDESLLIYLAEKQFIPNANMPTGLMTFECVDSGTHEIISESLNRIRSLKERINNVPEEQKNRCREELLVEKEILEKIKKSTTKTRELRVALNEYAPGQTVVVDEKNYISSGVTDADIYQNNGRYRCLSKCDGCGKAFYDVLDPGNQPNVGNTCPVCGGHIRGIINENKTNFTTFYEPLGFRTAASSREDRTEISEKRYYDITTELLPDNNTVVSDVNLCRINSSDNGVILYYNKGNNFGFNICGCGYAETANRIEDPRRLTMSHPIIWSRDSYNNCNANIRPNILLGGEFHTSFSTFVIKDDAGQQINNIKLLYSLGVILKRALVKYLGIDAGDVDFGVQMGHTNRVPNRGVLYLYDTNKGGSGYASIFANSDDAQKIFDVALTMLQECGCDCEKYEDAVCTSCLEERSTSRYVTLLSKNKVMQWLLLQKGILADVPQSIRDFSNDAKSSYLKLPQVLKQIVNDKEVSDFTIVGEIDDEMSTTAWNDSSNAIGYLLRKAVGNGKRVNVKFVVDDEYLNKYETVFMLNKLNDKMVGLGACVDFVKQQDDGIHIAISYSKSGRNYRYFTEQNEVLEVTELWGDSCETLFYDNMQTKFETRNLPDIRNLIVNEKLVRESDISKVGYSSIGGLWSIIKKDVGDNEINNAIVDILKDQKVNIYFKDNFCNSALSCLILVYLLKSIKTEYNLQIENIYLSFGTKTWQSYNSIDYAELHLNWNNNISRDNYVLGLIDEELDVNAEFDLSKAPHHRTLIIKSEKGYVEIRPDHSIGGGWQIAKKYFEIDRVGANDTMMVKRNEDIVYYVITKRN